MSFVKRIAGTAALGTFLTASTLAGAQAAAIYTAIDLTPSGFGIAGAAANGVADGQQVGVVQLGATDHATLWTGTAASAVDLNPSGFTSSGCWLY
jgi:hypothetical protein